MSFVNSVSATKTAQVISKIDTTGAGVSIQGALDATAIGNNLIDIVYPIGFIITTFTNTNPSTLLANTTWVRFGEGRCVVGVDDADTDFAEGATGGEKEHTLLENEMPSHSHTFADTYRNTTFPGADFSYGPNWASVPTNVIDQADTTNSAGGSQPFNIMNPYISCYMWRRTA